MTDAAPSATTGSSATTGPTPTKLPRNPIGITALVLALITIVVPIVAWIVLWVVGAAEANNADDAIMIGLLGGMVVFFGTIALLSPLSVIALVLGIVSLFRPGSRGPGIFAIIIGAIGSFGLFGLPVALGELIPGF
jgi:hypothetical protein